ncbi:MAG: hypothetical protein IGS50_22225 [Synechococcales cyanobacterium C42_A2020_086]|nr:hypothetical protein [Synechococcales cyanobacterium C42_A2020_086]
MPSQIQPIQIEHQPSPERLQQLGVWQWPIWRKVRQILERACALGLADADYSALRVAVQPRSMS